MKYSNANPSEPIIKIRRIFDSTSSKYLLGWGNKPLKMSPKEKIIITSTAHISTNSIFDMSFFSLLDVSLFLNLPSCLPSTSAVHQGVLLDNC